MSMHLQRVRCGPRPLDAASRGLAGPRGACGASRLGAKQAQYAVRAVDAGQRRCARRRELGGLVSINRERSLQRALGHLALEQLLAEAQMLLDEHALAAHAQNAQHNVVEARRRALGRA